MQSKGNEIPDHLLVKNPYTGTHINVLPLFEFFAKPTFSAKRSPDEAVEAIERALKYLTTNIPGEESDGVDYAQLNSATGALWDLRDVFKRMNQFP